MSALLLGAVAALGWGLYDFLIRFATRGAGGFQAVLLVLMSGAATLWVAALALGEPVSPPPGKLWEIALSGATYAGALVCGYRAFTIGPVSFVAPIISAYPVFTIMWAVANGSRPELVDWLGMVSVLIGVALVARFAAEQPDEKARAGPRSRAPALVYAGLACVLYAVSFAIGQLATQDASELSVTFFGRLWAIAVVLPLTLGAGITLTGARSWLPVLALMGGLDAVSLLAVNTAGQMEGAEYAVVIASTFGAVTVILAVLFLKERISMLQCLGIAGVFSGIVALSGRF